MNTGRKKIRQESAEVLAKKQLQRTDGYKKAMEEWRFWWDEINRRERRDRFTKDGKLTR